MLPPCFFTGSAVLVDCAIVKKRKAEFQSSRPTELVRIFGAACFTSSIACIDSTQRVGREKRRRTETADHRAAELLRIGCEVDHYAPRFETDFELLKKLKIGGMWEPNALRKELTKHISDPREIDALLSSRTPMGAAKRYVVLCPRKRKISPSNSAQFVLPLFEGKILNVWFPRTNP